jgi:hypothetical protein
MDLSGPGIDVKLKERKKTQKTEIDKGKENCDTNEVDGGGTKL